MYKIKIFLQNLFSLTNSKDRKHKVITIFGFKIKFLNSKYLYKELIYHENFLKILTEEQKNFFDFLSHNIDNNSILYIEPNIDSHAEVMPFFIKYFYDLGYNVDVVISTKLSNLMPFNRIKNIHFNTFYINYYLRHIFITEKVKQYKYIIFNSTIIYIKYNEIYNPNIFQYIPELNNYLNKLYVIEHHIESPNYELLNKNRCICLAKIPNISEKYIIANPHYFGDVKFTQKNDLTTFILVGALENFRRNTDLLINTVKKLAKQNSNFKITIIGRGDSLSIPKNIKKYFDIKGRIPFSEMFKAMEEADFFLTLFDPNNKEHERYIKKGTSGSFQLIYGFLKPCLIQKKFANVYNFSSKNSIVYEENENLYDSMIQAINMTKEDYKTMQDNLKLLVKDIENQSKNNLDKIFK